jgi:hypothetical protein
VQQDRSILVNQLQHFPAGTSARTIVHFAQMILQDKFQAFDWGEEENIKKYNNTRPSQVDLGRATPAQAIYVAPVITATSQHNNHNDNMLTPGQ